MGDDGRYRVSGEGTIVFQREHGAPLTLTDVNYVPCLKKNLVSIAMLEDKGYDVAFSKGKVFMRHIGIGQTKRIGIRVKNLYKLEVDDCAALISKAEMVQSQDVGELWHKILGHLHHGALKIMQHISTRLPKGKLEQKDTCKGCTLDIGSTLRKKKDQTLLRFCEFKALAEKESRNKIKALRNNNGGEYVSQQFKDFYSVEEIKRELTTPHNPQQNGVAKRKNRSIMGAAQAMLHDQSLPLHLWAKACNTIVYLHNRSPHHILGMKTPMEAFSEKRPDVSDFRIFGSSVYCHVTKDARKQLDPIAELGILVGYTDTPHNYRVFLPTSQTTMVRRDLKFDEKKAMRVPLERELKLHADEELSVPKEEEPHIDAE
eukprot:PITA_06173